MIEQRDSIWNWAVAKADAICITTNGCINGNGRAVMGCGIALQAKNRYSDIDLTLGRLLKKTGNHVYLLKTTPVFIFSFPTKDDWRNLSILALIKQSTQELRIVATATGRDKVLLPRVGCGYGGLDWYKQVKPILDKILDDRFIALSY